MLCSYLSALASTEPQGVVREAEKALHNNYLTEWELVHVVRVLTQMPTHVSTRVLRTLRKILASPHRRWLAAVEIVKLLAARGELERETLSRAMNTCPAVLRVDLVVAAKRMANSAHWARAFVETAKSDRVQAVVANHPHYG